MSWRDRAACAGVDPQVFFGSGKPTAAKAICAVCPVRGECLADALDWERRLDRADLICGVRGGLGSTERLRLIRRERREARELCKEGSMLFWTIYEAIEDEEEAA